MAPGSWHFFILLGSCGCFKEFWLIHCAVYVFLYCPVSTCQTCFYVGCVGRPRYNFESVSSSLQSHMVISHVPLLITEGEPCWPRLLLGRVTFCEISVFRFFSSRLFRFYSRTLRHQCDAGIAKQCS